MKTTIIYKNLLVLAAVVALIIPGAAIAKSNAATFQGTIQGALCVLDGKTCPPDDLDAHLLIEHNFVLLASDGAHYYLPNLNRTIKARYLGRDVRITGTVRGESIIVNTLEVKDGDKFKPVWSGEKQKRDIINYFENMPMG